MFSVHRHPHNPLATPNTEQPWRALAAFNPSPIQKEDGSCHLIYRAMTERQYYHGKNIEVSSIGICDSDDGAHYDNHREFITPQEDWELFGVEDPRVTEIDGIYYTFYTAISRYPFEADGIRVAVAVSDDLKTIKERHLVTPFNAKAMALFPDKIDGKLCAILTVHSDMPPAKMAIAKFDTPEDMWSESFWEEWYKNLPEHCIELRRDKRSDHAEVGAPPLYTERGWLLIYSHIQNYFTDRKIFGIEAVLLDHDDPRQIVARTRYPFMVPEESYERYGQLENIIFPSGATLEDDNLTVYYGGCDTVCANARLSLKSLLDEMENPHHEHVTRYGKNPILEPIVDNEWESKYVLNPTAIEIDDTVHILYRAIDPHMTSTIGYAASKDGLTIDERLPEPIYIPRIDAELKKGGPDGNSGCEDARIMQIEDRLYITYTAYNGVELPQVALSSISVDDFLAHKWGEWETPQIVSPKGIDDKDAAIFPEKINGKYMIIHRVDHHVCGDYVDDLHFDEQKLVRCIQMLGPRPGMWDSKKVGINGPPFRTEKGWVLFYHGINEANEYCVGAVLLDHKDPTVVIGRTAEPIMEPITYYEREGWIDNVIFSCGQVVRDDTIFIYYGGADTVVCVATMSLSSLLSALS